MWRALFQALGKYAHFPCSIFPWLLPFTVMRLQGLSLDLRQRFYQVCLHSLQARVSNGNHMFLTTASLVRGIEDQRRPRAKASQVTKSIFGSECQVVSLLDLWWKGSGWGMGHFASLPHSLLCLRDGSDKTAAFFSQRTGSPCPVCLRI